MIYNILQLRRRILRRIGDEASVSSVVGANFCAGFAAGCIAAAATCPLDVARTRRQIEVLIFITFFASKLHINSLSLLQIVRL